MKAAFKCWILVLWWRQLTAVDDSVQLLMAAYSCWICLMRYFFSSANCSSSFLKSTTNCMAAAAGGSYSSEHASHSSSNPAQHWIVPCLFSSLPPRRVLDVTGDNVIHLLDAQPGQALRRYTQNILLLFPFSFSFLSLNE